MKTLHLIANPHQIKACLTCLAPTDTILLIEWGVLAAIPPSVTNPLYALALDVQLYARPSPLPTIQTQKFVQLVEEHDQTIRW